jgi:hypothetical protein
MCLALLAGCAQPVTLSPELPAIPIECEAQCPAEPRLPNQDVRADVAARDRTELKRAYRCEQHYRATCVARLKVLLPQEGTP